MKDYKNRIVLPIAAVFFLLQLIFFAYNYNFHGLVFLTWLGWLLLLPGFLLIMVSESTWRGRKLSDNLELLKTRVSRLTPHPLFDGWLLVSLSLTLISQDWLAFFCMGVQIPLIIINIYDN
ncbi:MAG: hypothetical protein PVJ05_14285 [Candidatus Thorarchaeota archaeon]